MSKHTHTLTLTHINTHTATCIYARTHTTHIHTSWAHVAYGNTDAYTLTLTLTHTHTHTHTHTRACTHTSSHRHTHKYSRLQRTKWAPHNHTQCMHEWGLHIVCMRANNIMRKLHRPNTTDWLIILWVRYVNTSKSVRSQAESIPSIFYKKLVRTCVCVHDARTRHTSLWCALELIN